MALRRAGLFRELRHGMSTGPSLVEGRGVLDLELRSLASSYLRGGSVLATTGTMVGDWFEPSQTAVAPLQLRTNGTWVWPGDLAFYVDKYGVALPPEFLAQMASESWRSPPLSQAQLLAVQDLWIRDPGLG